MTPPSLNVAREILTAAAARWRASGPGSEVNESIAAAIDVVLAAIDQRAAPGAGGVTRPPLWQAVTRRLLIAQHPDETDDQFRDRVLQWRHAFEGDPVAAPQSPAAAVLDDAVERSLRNFRNEPSRYRPGATPVASAVRVPVIGEDDGPPIGSALVGGGRAAISMVMPVPADERRPLELRVMGCVSVSYRAEPAPGAPRVLCGLPVTNPVDGERRSCVLRFGHNLGCQVEPGPMSAAERAASLRADADRIEATAAAGCGECGAALPLSPGRPGCAECWAPTTAG